jgi:hypothetical protein
MEVENAISVNPAGLGNKVDCAVEDPQEFVWPIWTWPYLTPNPAIPRAAPVWKKVVMKILNSIYLKTRRNPEYF